MTKLEQLAEANEQAARKSQALAALLARIESAEASDKGSIAMYWRARERAERAEQQAKALAEALELAWGERTKMAQMLQRVKDWHSHGNCRACKATASLLAKYRKRAGLTPWHVFNGKGAPCAALLAYRARQNESEEPQCR